MKLSSRDASHIIQIGNHPSRVQSSPHRLLNRRYNFSTYFLHFPNFVSRIEHYFFTNQTAMADRDESEQPRKKIRLTEPESAANDSPIDTSISLEDQIKAQSEQETKFGITVFASPNSGFSGIVKQRYTDFLVNEIQLNGQVLHLDSLATPEKKPDTKQDAKSEDTAVDDSKNASDPTVAATNGPTDAPADNAGDQDASSREERKAAAIASISAESMSTLVAIFGERTSEAIRSLYGKVIANPDKKTRDYGNLVSDPVVDKQQRTDAHVAVRRIFDNRLETFTQDDNTITIKAAPQARGEKSRRKAPQRGEGPIVRGKVGWEEMGGEHLHFTLYKENKDTMEVVYFLASQMKLHTKNFQMAGTKDRRGVTVQRVSVFRTTKERLQGFNPTLRNAVLSGFRYEKNGLELGDLQGNEFTITLRDCQVPGTEGLEGSAKFELTKQTIDTAMEDFKKLGFINYYGLQRFGTFATSTDEIGRLMLQGNLKAATESILAFSDATLAAAKNPGSDSKISSDDKARAEALDLWRQSYKMGTVLDKLPRKFQAESAIVKHLGWVDRKTQKQNQLHDYNGALMQIARNLRLMYVHAYQSLVWNSAAATRLEKYGHKVVEGDLVLTREHPVAVVEQAPLDDVDDEGEVIIRPAIEDSATTIDEKFERARALTKEEAESGKYNMFDLVLPLPGYDVEYPKNAMNDFYIRFMAKDKLDPYNMRRKWKDISLSGGYRKILSRPDQVSYEVKTYHHEDEQLVQTDLEKLQAAHETDGKQTEAGTENSTVSAGSKDQEMTCDDTKIALVLRMQLGSSQYATMALRELTKGRALGYKPDFSGGR